MNDHHKQVMQKTLFNGLEIGFSMRKFAAILAVTWHCINEDKFIGIAICRIGGKWLNLGK